MISYVLAFSLGYKHKRYVYSRQRQLILHLDYVICLLTEQGILLYWAKQFDVVDFYKTQTQEVLQFFLFLVN